MARPLRIAYPGAVYHVTARGHERGAIVVDDLDREKWLALLGRTVERYRWRVFAFALMDNHYHLLLRTPDPNLSRGMQYLNGAYAGYHNARHGRAGHLLAGRFKAVLVEAEGHWQELSRYVHLNPVRAGIVARPEGWRWSSYPGYHRPARRLGWIDYGTVLREFGGDTPSGRRHYRRFMEAGLQQTLDSPLLSAVHGLVLGSDRFVARVRRMLDRRPDDPGVPDLSRLRWRPELGDVLGAVAAHFGTDPERWSPGRRCDDLARAVAAYLARSLTAAPSRRVASALGYRNPSSITRACRRVEAAATRPPLATHLRAILRRLGRQSR